MIILIINNNIYYLIQLFITGLNKFISIYGSITYFDEKKILAIVSPRKTLAFEIEKDNNKNDLILQITKVSGDKAKITDKKN